MKNMIIFTDLDGTLLDACSYSFEKALPALRLLQEREIPLVICSSKTKKEIEWYRVLLHNRHPFITENGGGIFIPTGCFTPSRTAPDMPLHKNGIYEVMGLGTGYATLRKAVCDLRNEGFAVTGFGDMTVEELAAVTGLPLEQAHMAKERGFDEPFLYSGGDDRIEKLAAAIREKGLSMTRGAFFHLLGKNHKGKAVAILVDLYRGKFGEVTSIALGDSPNDIPMLQCVDYPILVKKPDGHYDPAVRVDGLIRAEGIGPEGWNSALLDLLK